MDRFVANLVHNTIGLAVLVAFVLVIVKTIAWIVSGSVAIAGALLDSACDLCMSLVNLFVVGYAHTPADKYHRFGHGKAEAIASLAQSPVLAISGCWLLIHSFHRLIYPEPLDLGTLSIVIMIFSTILTLGLILVQRYALRRKDSLILKTDHAHCQADAFTNSGVLVGIILTKTLQMPWIDSALGIALGFYILHICYHLGRDALAVLMDKELDPAIREQIMTQAKKHPQVLGVHDLRTRSSSGQHFIQLHLVMNPTLTLLQAHKISEEVEGMIHTILPDADILIHEDPYDDRINQHHHFWDDEQ